MPLNTHYHCFFEVEYLDSNHELQKHFLSGYPEVLDMAKDFVTKCDEDGSVVSIRYFVEMTISEDNSTTAIQPGNKFGEKTFAIEEFLRISKDWVIAQRGRADEEAMKYMSERFDVISND